MTIKLLPTLVEPVVWHTPFAFELRRQIVDRCKNEVGWIGLGKQLEDGDYLIHDLAVLPQEVHSTECEFEDDAVSDWAEEFMEAGGDTTEFILWGHSHVDMTVSPSGTDIGQAAKYIKDCSPFICAIYNKQGDSRHDIYDRVKGVVFEDVYSTVDIPRLTDEQSTELDVLLEANVKPRKVTYPISAKGMTYAQGGYAYGSAGKGVNQKLWEALPAFATQVKMPALYAAGFKAPHGLIGIGEAAVDHMGLNMDDYIQYFLDEGRNGGMNEVYTAMYDDVMGDSWAANVYGNADGGVT